ncbi:MAG TPA: nuclear transport factor 2 family protein [Pseudonocardia sp.]|jgi:ketosteroid isomerase-like protein|nr:nuclear transport factor 2 family protein [Pseudonocardia sp.]
MDQNRAFVDRMLALLLAMDMTGFAELWAPDGVLEFPFAPPGYPSRLNGRTEVRGYLRDFPSEINLRAVTSLEVHQSVDPEVLVVEFEVDGVAVRTGRPYQLRYVAVLTVRDGQILRYRDYWSPLAAATALGGLDELTSAFAGPSTGTPGA